MYAAEGGVTGLEEAPGHGAEELLTTGLRVYNCRG